MQRGLRLQFGLLFWLTAVALAEPIDLPAIARGSGPAVLRLVIYDKTGNERGTATGFFVSDDGRIITNRHVLEGAVRIDAEPPDGPAWPIEGVLAVSSDREIAVLKAAVKNFARACGLGNENGASRGKHGPADNHAPHRSTDVPKVLTK